ncbi:Uncharacterized protein, linocin/CFP29 family [Anaerosphaera aminiphila DSM 21120]|uniref:Type 1 encapsulin shell protein n=1 Tax=Anaerosphaera aminiphila DSM 21120 TaxID=1120995 RepID=A0A1M5Q9F2_9FIRM|nr:family 1 encapsulin nanocompartment shell protein [Anaerosphaera aminiphila]SHH10784.1 Uncharacterized protein, linocin/CFP29 family [Anaerosphaera aminiphila DSM 21120]
MDVLKRSIAPVSSEAWSEIDNRAAEVIKSILSARKVLKVNGPKGWDYTSISEGRLKDLDGVKDKGNVKTGIFETQNLVEARIGFELDKWELDNIERGAKDIDFTNLEIACEQLAIFEENAIYNGYDKGNIMGLSKSAGHKLKLGANGNEILQSIGEGKYKLFNSYVEGPFDLLVSPEAYNKINTVYEGAFLMHGIEKLIGGEIIRSKALKGALLIPHRDEDLEFTVGQDFSIGFERELEKTVRLFATETFTFRILDESKIVSYSL